MNVIQRVPRMETKPAMMMANAIAQIILEEKNARNVMLNIILSPNVLVSNIKDRL